MSYRYDVERDRLFTEEGQRLFLEIRDRAARLLALSGAVSMGKAINGSSGDTWRMMACVDRMKELGELREVTNANVRGQDRVFVRAGDHGQ